MTPPLLHIDKQGSSSAFRGRNSSSPDGVAQQRDVRPLDHRTLEKELRAVIEGEVRFDEGSRALYATDGSNYRQVPIGVVIPRHAEDVVRAIAVARDHGAPVLSRGGGTSLAGQCCNEAVVLDFSKYMHGIWELNPQAKRARIQPGIVLDALRQCRDGRRRRRRSEPPRVQAPAGSRGVLPLLFPRRWHVTFWLVCDRRPRRPDSRTGKLP